MQRFKKNESSRSIFLLFFQKIVNHAAKIFRMLAGHLSVLKSNNHFTTSRNYLVPKPHWTHVFLVYRFLTECIPSNLISAHTLMIKVHLNANVIMCGHLWQPLVKGFIAASRLSLNKSR